MVDDHRRGLERFDMVKALMTSMTNSVDRIKEQFPEYFDPFEEARTEDGGYDIDKIDGAAVEWGTPDGEDEDEALAKWINTRETGTVSAADWEV